MKKIHKIHFLHPTPILNHTPYEPAPRAVRVHRHDAQQDVGRAVGHRPSRPAGNAAGSQIGRGADSVLEESLVQIPKGPQTRRPQKAAPLAVPAQGGPDRARAERVGRSEARILAGERKASIQEPGRHRASGGPRSRGSDDS